VPGRQREDLEVRVGDLDPDREGTEVQYRWLSDGEDWLDAVADGTDYRIPLREAGAFQGNFLLKAFPWPEE
jgi:hypothetical protein